MTYSTTRHTPGGLQHKVLNLVLLCFLCHAKFALVNQNLMLETVKLDVRDC